MTEFPRLHYAPIVLTVFATLIVTPLVWRKATYRPEVLPPAPKDYHYTIPVGNESSSTLLVPDGRQIGYAQYGDLNGKPVIVLHGILGSRLENALFDSNAKELGIRIIGIERPGYGWSTPDPRPLKGRRIGDFARDVEALAEHLNLEEYAIIGMSGGAPYAFGCAYALPSSASKPRLKAVSIVTGLGLADMSQSWPAPLVWLNRNLDLRWLIKRLFVSGPVWNMTLSDAERAEAMRQSLDLKKARPADVGTAMNSRYPDMVRVFLRSSREAIRQGLDGFADDAAILSKDPGFRVEDVRADLPVQLWCGTHDTNVAPKAGLEYAQRLRATGNIKVEMHMEEGETHGSVQVKYQRRILKDLLRTMGV